jgi:phage head maturation protease
VKLKSAPVHFKADGASLGDAGEFEAIVSVFDNVDSWGDVVRPGAFLDTIDEWRASKNAFPVLFSHRMDDPRFNIGELTGYKELAPGADEIPDWVEDHVKAHGGLWVKGLVDTGPDASPIAVHTLRLMKARRIAQFSYAYDEVEAGWAKSDGESVWELRKLKLYEVSPTQIGANEMTELLAAKSRTSTDRPFARKDREVITQTRDLLTGILSGLDSDDDGSDKAKDEDPPGVKSSRVSPESSRASVAEFRAGLTAD